MPQIVCPICRQSFDTELSSALPFCSERCRMVDLGRWLNEDYGLPVESDEGEEGDSFDANDD